MSTFEKRNRRLQPTRTPPVLQAVSSWMVLIGCVSSTGQGTAFKGYDDDLVSVQFSALTVTCIRK
jgi:hypothetical protein